MIIKNIFFLCQVTLKRYACDMDTSAAHTCIKCDKYINVLCGTSCEEGLLCPNCKVDSNRVRHRSDPEIKKKMFLYEDHAHDF
jgi:hypothetical protein